MLQSRRDKQAELAVKRAILGLSGLPAIERIQVLSGEDHDGVPALSVTIYLKAAQGRMSGAQLLDAITAASTALRENDDERFPFVTFLEPEDERESAEDTRPAA